MHISPYVEPRSRHSVLLSVGRLRGELSGSREPITLRRTLTAIRPRDRSRNGSPGLCPGDRTEIRRFKLQRQNSEAAGENLARASPGCRAPCALAHDPHAKAFGGLRAAHAPQGPSRGSHHDRACQARADHGMMTRAPLPQHTGGAARTGCGDVPDRPFCASGSSGDGSRRQCPNSRERKRACRARRGCSCDRGKV